MQEWVLLKKNIQTINLKITKCIRIFFSDYQLVLRWMDPQQHQDCRLWHPTPWFENGCYLHWKHNCHSRIVQAHQRTIHRYVQAQGNKIIEWDFFLSRAFCIVSVTWSYFFYYGKKYPFANVKIWLRLDSKDQIISEWFFSVLIFPKNQRKYLNNFCLRIWKLV